jgi:hypothetical protein
MANTKRRRATATISREKRAARSQIQLGVKRLEKSIAEIQKSLRRAERTIEADARARIRALRKEARAQLTALAGRRREVARTYLAQSNVPLAHTTEMLGYADASDFTKAAAAGSPNPYA